MAGGRGERFWPISRSDRPKQLLNLGLSEATLLDEAVDRLLPLVGRDSLFVVTGEHLREPILSANLPLEAGHVLVEPCKRNTAGCIAYATAHVLAEFDAEPADVTFAIIPADHFVTDADAFRSALRTAMAAAEQKDSLLVVGIAPTRPETGYGYIQVASDTGPVVVEGAEGSVWPVASFREKPSPDVAREFLASGQFLWNTGTFVWRGNVFMEEMERARPEIAAVIRDLIDAMRDRDDGKVRELFARLPDISIDYALMERASRVMVVRANFAWDDLGAWDAFHRVGNRDEAGNVAVGDPVLINCRDCVVYNEMGQDKIAVSVVGMDGTVVAVSDDGVLVVPVSRAQEVREAVAALRRLGARQV